MNEYAKKIELSDTGMVICEVRNKANRTRVYLGFYDFCFDSIEKRFQKAHRKADEIIALCEKYEITEARE